MGIHGVLKKHFPKSFGGKCPSQVRDQGELSILERTKKSVVEPPPSPTTPTSHRQLFCNFKQVNPCGKLHLLIHMRAVRLCLSEMIKLNACLLQYVVPQC